jgi:hypothetical protein
MGATDTVKAMLAAIEDHRLDEVGRYLTDDFMLSGSVSHPLDKAQFLEWLRGLLAALPDWSLNVQDAREQGDTVSVMARVSGTQDGVLSLASGAPPVQPTGMHVALPAEPFTFMLRGDKISSITVASGPDTGMPGLYKQVGHPLPGPGGMPQSWPQPQQPGAQ